MKELTDDDWQALRLMIAERGVDRTLSTCAVTFDAGDIPDSTGPRNSV
jgi:hypothetical protein